jgi:hypothetical protein
MPSLVTGDAARPSDGHRSMSKINTHRFQPCTAPPVRARGRGVHPKADGAATPALECRGRGTGVRHRLHTSEYDDNGVQPSPGQMGPCVWSKLQRGAWVGVGRSGPLFDVMAQTNSADERLNDRHVIIRGHMSCARGGWHPTSASKPPVCAWGLTSAPWRRTPPSVRKSVAYPAPAAPSQERIVPRLHTQQALDSRTAWGVHGHRERV